MFINFQDRFTRARCVLFLNLVVLKLTFLIILKLLHTTGRLHFFSDLEMLGSSSLPTKTLLALLDTTVYVAGLQVLVQHHTHDHPS